MPIAIHPCSNKFQDERHGVNCRVVNPINKSKLNGVVQKYRCTVCKGEVPKTLVVKA